MAGIHFLVEPARFSGGTPSECITTQVLIRVDTPFAVVRPARYSRRNVIRP